jgi:AAA15 family ATPase/GTPase
MLKELYIENYKSLKNVTVQFKDGLNIIIGKNGSGKSNLLEFIDDYVSIRPVMFLDIVSRFSSDYNYFFLYKSGGKNVEVNFRVESEYFVDDKPVRRRKIVTVSKRYLENSEPFQLDSYKLPDEDNWSSLNILINSLRDIIGFESILIKFNIPNNVNLLDRAASWKININNHNFYSLERPIEYFNFINIFADYFEKQILGGYNLSNELDSNKKIFLESFDNFVANRNITNALKAYSPIEKVRISRNANTFIVENNIIFDNITLEFYLNHAWVPWGYLSDGTKRLFYLISEVCSQEYGLVLIEEPELGVHPDQLFKLMQFIKEQSETKQIIVSTHSPIVLDALKANELDRIIIAKAETGHSQFYKLSEKKIEKAKRYMTEVAELSYYWLHSDMEDNDD